MRHRSRGSFDSAVKSMIVAVRYITENIYPCVCLCLCVNISTFQVLLRDSNVPRKSLSLHYESRNDVYLCAEI